MADEVPDFRISQDLERSAVNALYGNKLNPDQLDEAKQNLANFLKLLVRIDQRIRNEKQNAGN